MYCKVCRHAGSKNAFTKGCTDFQSSALQRHRELGKHKDALKLAPEQKLMLGQSKQKKDIDATKQKSLLHTVLYMTKRQLPDVEFHSLVDLQKANGCTSLSTGHIYTHHSSITKMKASLASVVRALFNKRYSTESFCRYYDRRNSEHYSPQEVDRFCENCQGRISSDVIPWKLHGNVGHCRICVR